MAQHIFEYFPSAGRGEGIRVALHAAGIAFEEKNFTSFQEWQDFKAKSTSFVYKGGLPVLTVDGKKFAQSSALLRYAGKKAKMYSDDDLVAMRIDELIDNFADVMNKAPKSSGDEAAFKKAREEYAAGIMANYMSRLSECADESSTEWIAGTDDMSIADLCMWQLFSMIRTGNFTGIPADYTEKWPKLAKLEKAVPEHPAFKAYKEWKEKK